MERRPIPRTDLQVSTLCLGTMTFGTPVAEPEAVGIVHRALDMGVNFIDTANMYEGYTRTIGSPGGVGEALLGRGLVGRRDEAVVATKVGMAIGPTPDDEGLSPAHVARECDRSLGRLGIDTIDLYYMHKPDPSVPVADSAGAIARLIDAGKVRHWGLSNFDAEQTRQVLTVCDEAGLPRPVAHQPAFSLLHRAIEADLLPLCRAEGLAVVPYRVLEGGLLSGKYGGAVPPAGSRGAEQPAWVPGLEDADLRERTAALAAEATAAGRSLFDYALRATAAVPGITSLILGVSRAEQIDAAVAALTHDTGA